MLAYVFWHERRADADDAAYRADAAEFHRRLTAAALPGFLGSRTFAIETFPWRDDAGATLFEDWYVLRGSAELDRLDEIAVSGDRSPPHDRLASAVRVAVSSESSVPSESAAHAVRERAVA